MNTDAIRSALVCALGSALALLSGLAWSQTTYRLTDLSSGLESTGQAINASGQVTGQSMKSRDFDGVWRAFLWNGTTVQDLGTLDGLYSVATGINDSGQVVGYSDAANETATHAFVWDGTKLQDLGTLGGSNSTGHAINAAGQVTGASTTAGDAEIHASLWTGTAVRDLGTLGGAFSTGQAINAAGQVTGFSLITGNEAYHAFLWDGTAMQDIGTLGGTSSGFDINDSGQVTGYSYTTTTGDAVHAFLWDGTSLQDLGTLGGSYSIGFAINSSGQVTGQASTVDEDYHAFLWNGSAMQDLGTLGGTYSGAYAINASGQVTGQASTADDAAYHAFLWNGTTMEDVNSLIDPADRLRRYVTLVSGHDINDVGQIVADGCDSRSTECHAYLLTPVSMNDTTPPLVQSKIIGKLGKGGWYVSAVSIRWEVTDSESAISERSGCDPVIVSADTAGTTLTCTATSAGGTTTESVRIRRDATAPTISIVTPAIGAIYSRNQVVIASYSCSDAPSGVLTCTGNVANGQPINTSKKAQNAKFRVTATDGAGNNTKLTTNYTVN